MVVVGTVVLTVLVVVGTVVVAKVFIAEDSGVVAVRAILVEGIVMF